MKNILILSGLLACMLLLQPKANAQADTQTTAANEQRVAREMYAETSGKKIKKGKRKRLNLNDNYYLIGLSYATALGGDDAPYKGGVDLMLQYAFPLAKDRLLLTVDFNSGIQFPASTSWYARSLNIPEGSLESVSIGFSEQVGVGLMPVIVNKKKLTFAAGPFIGIRYQYLADYNSASGQDFYSLSTTPIFSPCFGVRAMLYVGNTFTAYAEYNKATTSSVKVMGGSQDYTVPANFDMLKIGIAARLDYLGWW